jgi:phage-related protein
MWSWRRQVLALPVTLVLKKNSDIQRLEKLKAWLGVGDKKPSAWFSYDPMHALRECGSLRVGYVEQHVLD